MALGFLLGYVVQRKLQQRKRYSHRHSLEAGKLEDPQENLYSQPTSKTGLESSPREEYLRPLRESSEKNLSQELLNNFKKPTNTNRHNLHTTEQ